MFFNICMSRYTLVVFLSALVFSSFSQKGKHGAGNINTLNVRVNEFTQLTANASAGSQTISVANSGLNQNSRFSGTLQVGDLLMIIQMQGAAIKTFSTVGGQDSTYGEILNYNGAGNYEFAQVFAIPNATSIVLDCGLTNGYLSSGRTQIVRVPRYTSLTVTSSGLLTTDAWNGTVGGILAVEVNGLTTINGTVTATGLGFRGGIAANNSNYGGGRFVDLGGGADEGGLKGESIAGYTLDLATNFNGAYAKGAPANGGGGGNSHNAGGGGGANAGNINGWFGSGVINPSYTLAYSLEYPGRHLVVSSGGGKGGYAFSSANLNPNTNPPGSASWGGDSRRNHGGFGGRPLDYSTGRIYLGGGGGAGHVNNINAQNTGGTGGNGGGIVYFLNTGNITGTGIIVSNGANGVTATGPNPGPFSSSVNGNDSGGGGGAGGTILLATGGVVSGVTINANGGRGGDQIIVKGGFAGSNTEAEGPGGGGGGGYIALSNGTPVQNVLGALSGTTNSQPMGNFLPNGATNGADGLKEQDVKFYYITVANQTVCVNTSATLTASSNNPLASTYVWYNSPAGTTQLGTGSAFTTSVFTTAGNYTFYVGTCPGHFREPVVVTVVNPPVISVNSATICQAQSATLTASGATTYTWSTGSNASSVIVTPTATTIYTVSGTAVCVAQNTAMVTVQPAPSLTLTPSSTLICNSQSVILTATGSSGTYSWSTGAGNTSTIAVANGGVYSVTLTNQCGAVTRTVNLTEGAGTSITLGASQNTVCSGGSVTITASATGTINWSTGATNVNSIVVNAPGVYTATLTNECGTGISSYTINNGPLPGLNLTTGMVCEGQTATVTASGGATSYSWSNGATGPVMTTTIPGIYSVVASNSCGISTGSIMVHILPIPTLSLAASTTVICEGQSATLFASANQAPPTFSWSSSANTTNIEQVNSAGIYIVTYSTMCGNPSASISIVQSTLSAGFTFSPSTGNAPLKVDFTNTSSNNISNQWVLGNGNNANTLNANTTYTAPGIYTITLMIQNPDGCTASVSRTIEVLLVELGIIPELITPNGDGKNETFEIKGLERYPNTEIEIYNRWGNLVYSKKNYDNSWDGTSNFGGQQRGKLPVGTYYVILKFNNEEGRVYKGFVELQY